MVLVVVDDLMFSSRISTAAKQLGVDVVFTRTLADMLQRARTFAPALVILDLNARTIDPLAAIAALKDDPALHGIRTLGFVSHVDADTIVRARSAGVDEVLARSAFTARLGEILKP